MFVSHLVQLDAAQTIGKVSLQPRRRRSDVIFGIFTDGSSASDKRMVRTMVLLQCQTQLRRFVRKNPEKWSSPFLNADSLMPEAANSSAITADNTSPCIFTPAVGNCDKRLWSRKRAPGRRTECLTAVTPLFLRGWLLNQVFKCGSQLLPNSQLTVILTCLTTCSGTYLCLKTLL